MYMFFFFNMFSLQHSHVWPLPWASAVESAWAHPKTSGMIECVHTGRSSLQTQTRRYGLLIPVITVLNIESKQRAFSPLNLLIWLSEKSERD